jgi:hypothetical protein
MNDDTDQQKAAQSVLRTYVNDMIAVERDIANALKGQREDEHVAASSRRLGLWRDLRQNEEASGGKNAAR